MNAKLLIIKVFAWSDPDTTTIPMFFQRPFFQFSSEIRSFIYYKSPLCQPVIRLMIRKSILSASEILDHVESKYKKGYDIILGLGTKMLGTKTNVKHFVNYAGGFEKDGNVYRFNIKNAGKTQIVEASEEEIKDYFYESISGRF